MAVYLDYNASAPINSEVLDEMVCTYKNSYGNADSRTHDFGEKARSVTENARHQTAELLGVKADEVFFTGGSTESNNIAILGLREYAEMTNKKHIITTAIEHHSVLNTVKYLEKTGFTADYVLPYEDGRIKADELLSFVKNDTLLVSVIHVSNETGMIQPVKEIGEELARRNVLFHVDATQSCGKMVEEIKELKYDMLSLSAHKFQGPQGIGALILRRKKYRLPPVKNIMYGGQQEHGLRPGTTPVALAAGMGKASELALKNYKKNHEHIARIKKVLIEELNNSGVHFKFNGDQDYCSANTINLQFEGVSSEALMISTKQYCGVSNGSACTSKDYSPSYVLKAMGLTDDEAYNSVRISWGPDTELESVKSNFNQLLKIVKEFQ